MAENEIINEFPASKEKREADSRKMDRPVLVDFKHPVQGIVTVILFPPTNPDESLEMIFLKDGQELLDTAGLARIVTEGLLIHTSPDESGYRYEIDKERMEMRRLQNLRSLRPIEGASALRKVFILPKDGVSFTGKIEYGHNLWLLIGKHTGFLLTNLHRTSSHIGSASLPNYEIGPSMSLVIFESDKGGNNFERYWKRETNDVNHYIVLDHIDRIAAISEKTLHKKDQSRRASGTVLLIVCANNTGVIINMSTQDICIRT